MEIVQATLYNDFLGTPSYFWLIFVGIVITLLVLDLGVLHKSDRVIGARESFALYGFYMAIAFLFGAWVWWSRGSQSGLEFFTGYLIEQSLSMDNIFVIATIFGTFAIPQKYQHRVLFWGIIGVIVFRAILIGVGAALVMSFSWILYLFGLFLVFTGVKMFMKSDHAPDMENNVILKWLRKHFRITKELHGHDFLARLPDPKPGNGHLDDAPAGGAYPGGIRRSRLRGQFRPAIFANSTDHIHCLYLQHLCNSGPSFALFRPRSSMIASHTCPIRLQRCSFWSA